MLATAIQVAVQFYDAKSADALVLLLDKGPKWETIKEHVGDRPLMIASHVDEILEAASNEEISNVRIETEEVPVFEKLAQALLDGVAAEVLPESADVVAVYSGFHAGKLDTMSFIRLDEHLNRLTARDLRRLETSVPLETLKLVMDLAVDIGREGREGKPVGTMFVIGDTRKVTTLSQSAGFDPLKGYAKEKRDLKDRRVREAIKEVAQLDGAFLVSPEGIADKACRIVETTHANITLSAGLGARHWAAAAITKNTNAVAVVVSESNGTVRLFQNGEVLLRVEPFHRRPMKWKDFKYEPPASSAED